MVSRVIGIFRRNGDGDDLDCRQVARLSSDYIDDALGGDIAQKILAHTSRCGPCNTFIRTLRNTVDLLRGAPKHQAPDDFKSRIRSHIANSGEQ